MLREVFLEADSIQINDDCDSDASSSSDSEDEKIAETEKMKKALEDLQSTLDKVPVVATGPQAPQPETLAQQTSFTNDVSGTHKSK